MIQQEAYRFTARPCAGQQHQRYLPVVELRAIRIPCVNGSLEATRTVLAVAGMALVAINGGDAGSVMIRQRLVTLQPA